MIGESPLTVLINTFIRLARVRCDPMYRDLNCRVGKGRGVGKHDDELAREGGRIVCQRKGVAFGGRERGNRIPKTAP